MLAGRVHTQLLINGDGLVREVVVNTIVVNYTILENLNKGCSSMCVGTLKDIRRCFCWESMPRARNAHRIQGVFSCRQGYQRIQAVLRGALPTLGLVNNDFGETVNFIVEKNIL